VSSPPRTRNFRGIVLSDLTGPCRWVNVNEGDCAVKGRPSGATELTWPKPEFTNSADVMRIVRICQGVLPITSSMSNALIDFGEVDCSIVAVVSNVVREGRPLVGYGFNSNEHYSQGEIIRRRLVPRLLAGKPYG
jgi:hypothetical protein